MPPRRITGTVRAIRTRKEDLVTSPDTTLTAMALELEYGITVYPPRPGRQPEQSGPRWRAVWYEDGQRRQCESVSEDKLAAKLEKVTERLEADAPNMKRPGADLIAHYLDPDRLPPDRAVVPQARPHPAAAVRAVRRPGHRHGHLPGHQDPAHAADRQRRAHRRARATGCTG